MTDAELIERAIHDDGFGFVIHWRFDEHWVDVKVYEVVSLYEDGKIEFQRKDSNHSPDGVDSVADAEVYADGFIKWDGCCEIDWGQSHWCGAFWWERQFKLMRYIHDRAFELMGLPGEDALSVPTPTAASAP